MTDDINPREFFEAEVRPRLKVETVFGDVPGLRPENKVWRAPCPFHRDPHAPEGSLVIDPDTLHWTCFSGAHSGGPIEFVQAQVGCTPQEAVGLLALRARVKAPGVPQGGHPPEDAPDERDDKHRLCATDQAECPGDEADRNKEDEAPLPLVAPVRQCLCGLVTFLRHLVVLLPALVGLFALIVLLQLALLKLGGIAHLGTVYDAMGAWAAAGTSEGAADLIAAGAVVILLSLINPLKARLRGVLTVPAFFGVSAFLLSAFLWAALTGRAAGMRWLFIVYLGTSVWVSIELYLLLWRGIISSVATTGPRTDVSDR